jgi:hypothetical protein
MERGGGERGYGKNAFSFNCIQTYSHWKSIENYAMLAQTMFKVAIRGYRLGNTVCYRNNVL